MRSLLLIKMGTNENFCTDARGECSTTNLVVFVIGFLEEQGWTR